MNKVVILILAFFSPFLLADGAQYDPATKVLTIPHVQVEGWMFFDLQLKENELGNFEVVKIAEHPENSSRKLTVNWLGDSIHEGWRVDFFILFADQDDNFYYPHAGNLIKAYDGLQNDYSLHIYLENYQLKLKNEIKIDFSDELILDEYDVYIGYTTNDGGTYYNSNPIQVSF